MADYKVDMRDIKFVLNEYLGVSKLLELPKYKDFSADDFNMIVDEAAKMATEVLAPMNTDSDRIGATYNKETTEVTTPPGYKDAFKLYAESGWGAASMPQDFGGQGLPELIGTACGEIFTGANCAFTMAPGLSKAAANVIINFGSDAQKALYVEKMLNGTWAGTMCLTEPQAGSDVGATKTVATPIPGRDNWFKVIGTKSFITFGDHDLAENVIHLVLARTPGAPAGTKGIGLFIVPKYRIDANGKTTDKRNDMCCGGIEHKMGIHGSPTCTLNFGESDDCEGELIGDVYSGIKYMFLMMNEERLMVGMQGEALGAASYMGATQFATERVQGPDIRNMKDPEAPKVTIINHPDVRRMLMTMKAYTEGMRALLYNTAYFIDMAHGLQDPKEARKYSGWVELLTPICKAYCTDMAFYVTELGVQVHGGYGYCAEYPAEQYLRDCKITSIYEGTNGIQALDLLGRKVPMGGGSVLMGYIMDMNGKLAQMKKHAVCGEIAALVEKGKDVLSGVLMKFMKKEAFGLAVLNACSLLEMFGNVVCAFYLTEQAIVAADKFAEMCKANKIGDDAAARAAYIKDSSEAKYYNSKVQTAKFFAAHLLPKVYWREKVIENADMSCLDDVL